jgi:hypothetical protein
MHIANWLIPAAVIAVCVIAWLAKRRASKSKSPPASVKAGPGNTGPGTGSPR